MVKNFCLSREFLSNLKILFNTDCCFHSNSVFMLKMAFQDQHTHKICNELKFYEYLYYYSLPVMATTEYTKVTSGTGCERITSKEECERAAKALGLSDTTATTITNPNAPPYCFNYKGSCNAGVSCQGLKYNTEGDLTIACSSIRDCLCKGQGKLSATQLVDTLQNGTFEYLD